MIGISKLVAVKNMFFTPLNIDLENRFDDISTWK